MERTTKKKPKTAAVKFLEAWRALGIDGSEPETEYVFDSERHWRFDYAWPALKVAVEVHGFGFGHQAQQHLAADCEKARAAIEHGWVVLTFTTRCLGSKVKCEDAAHQVYGVIERRAESLVLRGKDGA